MSYSVNLLTTASDCDNLLAKLAKEKDDLDFRITQVSRQRKSYQLNSVEIAADLQAAEGEITTLTAMLETMANGDRKEKTITDLDRAKLRKRVLLDRQKDYGSIALIEREVELSMTIVQLAEITAAIAEVEARKAAL